MFGGPQGPISAKGNQYAINFKSQEWSAKKDERSDYVFENNKDGRILLSNSFCDEFQEKGLDVLARKTFNTVDGFEVREERFLTFHNREAYRLEGTGKVDGVEVLMKIQNTRRNNCYFDFVSIIPKSAGQTSDPEFEQFLGSVDFK